MIRYVQESERLREELVEARKDSLSAFVRLLVENRAWSDRTFGLGPRTHGVTDHIEKELREIRDDPDDAREWIDVILLAIDGYGRAGGAMADLFPLLAEKIRINWSRKWQTPQPGKAVEHVRECDAARREAPRCH